MNENFEQIRDFIKAHLDDPDSLSTSIISLSAYLYQLHQEIAQADLDEEKMVTTLMDNTPRDTKPMSATEANSRAKVLTNNMYKLKNLESEAIKEYINAVKVRITVLSWEHRNSNNG